MHRTLASAVHLTTLPLIIDSAMIFKVWKENVVWLFLSDRKNSKKTTSEAVPLYQSR